MLFIIKHCFLIITFSFLVCTNLYAKQYALIIQLRAGQADLESEMTSHCKQLEAILTEGQYVVTKAETLQEIKDAFEYYVQNTGKIDELSIYILGYASGNAKRITLLAKDGRYSADELSEALDKIPAYQKIYLFHAQSAALFQQLAKGERFILAANDDTGQLSVPRYPAFYIAACKELGANANAMELAARAGDITKIFYKENSLLRSENSQLYFNGKKDSYPFDEKKLGVFELRYAEKESSVSKVPEFKTFLGDNKKLQPPSAERKILYDDAKSASEGYSDYPYVCVSRKVALFVNRDKSYSLNADERFFIRKKLYEAIYHILERINAEVIFEDGSWLDCKNIPASDLPIYPDSFIIMKRQRTFPMPDHLPEFHFTYALYSNVPVLSTELELKHDANIEVARKFFIPDNLAQDVVDDSAKGIYKIGVLQPYALVPQEAHSYNSRLTFVATTLKNWDDFFAWNSRLTDRALNMNDQSKEFLASLLGNAGTEKEKVEIIYDYLNSLRYLTTPIGASALRPQSVNEVLKNSYGDCKDKATAMVAMCREVGVEAYRVLLNRGIDLDPSFAAWQFNHMMVYIPKLEGFEDGLWIDPTDGMTTFGDLPPGDFGSTGMILKEDSYEFKKITLPSAVKNSSATEIVLMPAKTKENADVFFVDITKKNEGLPLYYALQTLSEQLPEMNRYHFETMLAGILPAADFTDYNVMAETSRIRAFLPAEYFRANALNLMQGIDRNFILPESDRAIRLFDGRPYSAKTILTVNGYKFESREFERSNEDFAISIIAENNSVAMDITFKNALIRPKEYSEIRRFFRDAKKEMDQIINKISEDINKEQ